ncbi:MAG: hypothetical protein ACE5PV_02535 [Candidatus Poribacteria bacterium]
MNEQIETIIIVEDTKTGEIKDKRVLRAQDYPQLPEFLTAVLQVKEELRQKYPGEGYVLHEGSAEALSTLAASYSEHDIFRDALISEPIRGILAVEDINTQQIAEYQSIDIDLSNPQETFAEIQEVKKGLAQKFPGKDFRIIEGTARDLSSLLRTYPEILSDPKQVFGPDNPPIKGIPRHQLDPHRLEQESLNELIYGETERLTSFIYKLYEKFRLAHFREEELYDHICREAAQYFHADGASLFLVQYDIDKYGKLRKRIELVGAFGPWARALRPKHVRVKQPTQHELDEYESGEKIATSTSVNAYLSPFPILHSTRLSFEMEREWKKQKAKNASQVVKNPASEAVSLEIPAPANFAPASESQETIPRNETWLCNNLYNVCRNMLSVSIARREAISEGSKHCKIGLLKVENRSPHAIEGFRSTASVEGLFFKHLWELAAIRPYLQDLKEPMNKLAERIKGLMEKLASERRVEEIVDTLEPLSPLRNHASWQQYYDDNSTGREHFQRFKEWIDEQNVDIKEALKKREQIDEKVEDIFDKYTNLSKLIDRLLCFITEAETLLQNMADAKERLDELTSPTAQAEPPLIAPHGKSILAPSFFNVHNLVAALTEKSKTPEIPSNSTAHCLQEQLRQFRVSFPNAEKAVAEVDDLAAHVTQGLLNGGPSDLKLGDYFNGKATWDFNFAEAVNCLLEKLQIIAKALRESTPQGNTAWIVAEERETKNIAEAILLEGEINPQIEKVKKEKAQELEIKENDIKDEQARLLLLAEWTATAAMHAHTFDQMDCHRLSFISGHVCQVLDIHLLQQAKQRKIPIDYMALGELGLESFALDKLSVIQMLAGQIQAGLSYLVKRTLLKLNVTPPVNCEALRLERLFKDIRDALENEENQVKVEIVSVQAAYSALTQIASVIENGWTSRGNGRVLNFSPKEKPEKLTCLLDVPISDIQMHTPAWLLNISEALQQLKEVIDDEIVQ